MVEKETEWKERNKTLTMQKAKTKKKQIKTKKGETTFLDGVYGCGNLKTWKSK